MNNVKIMKGIQLPLLFSLIVILSSSCKYESNYYDYRLKVLNNSDRTIYADFYQSYPDTALSINSHFGKSNDKTPPKGTIVLVRGGTWETAFKEQINEKLIVFIFNADVVDNEPWDTIRKYYLILKRYDLTIKDLDSLNFEIIYP